MGTVQAVDRSLDPHPPRFRSPHLHQRPLLLNRYLLRAKERPDLAEDARRVQEVSMDKGTSYSFGLKRWVLSSFPRSNSAAGAVKNGTLLIMTCIVIL